MSCCIVVLCISFLMSSLESKFNPVPLSVVLVGVAAEMLSDVNFLTNTSPAMSAKILVLPELKYATGRVHLLSGAQSLTVTGVIIRYIFLEATEFIRVLL
jgi:hypothetical protein